MGYSYPPIPYYPIITFKWQFYNVSNKVWHISRGETKSHPGFALAKKENYVALIQVTHKPPKNKPSKWIENTKRNDSKDCYMIKLLITKYFGQLIDESRIKAGHINTKNFSKKQKRQIIDCLNESDEQRKIYYNFMSG